MDQTNRKLLMGKFEELLKNGTPVELIIGDAVKTLPPGKITSVNEEFVSFSEFYTGRNYYVVWAHVDGVIELGQTAASAGR